jgi:DNA replication licensing factor MCM7
LNLGEDGQSDEYDFMDESDDGAAGQRSRRQEHNRDPKKKYMQMLQDVADRATSQITIDLDDLDAVGILRKRLDGMEELMRNWEQYEKSLGDEADFRLVSSIEKNAFHYIEVFSRAVDKVMPESVAEPKSALSLSPKNEF